MPLHDSQATVPVLACEAQSGPAEDGQHQGGALAGEDPALPLLHGLEIAPNDSFGYIF